MGPRPYRHGPSAHPHLTGYARRSPTERKSTVPVEIRPFAEDDRQPVRRLRYRTFTADTFEVDEDGTYVEDERRVVAELDGRIVGHAAAWRHGQFFGGRPVPMAGVAAVIVEPQVRGRGVATALVRALIDRVREQGDAIATLFPATVAPYRRLGWELAGTLPRHTLPTRALLSIAPPAGDVQLRPARADDLEALQQRYREAVALHDGWLDLDPRYRAYNAGDPDDRGADEWWVAERDGEVTGYTLYSREDRDDAAGGNRLIVRELIATDADTERALWRLVGGSWTVWPTTQLRGEVEPVVQHLLAESEAEPEPGEWARWMTRVLDLPEAVAARGYPAGLSGAVHLDVQDHVVEANAGRWVLEVRGGRASATRGGDGTVRTDVGALSATYTGATSATSWHRLGRLVTDDATALELLDETFRGPTPTGAHYF